MEEVTLQTIKAKALTLHEAHQTWHFHILTPSCQLNTKASYAFILECPEQRLAIVHYSNQAEKALGQELSPLLHGNKVLDQNTTDVAYKPSPTVLKIIERAKELNAEKVEWHHHVLFPGCQFNTNSPKFTLMFEDPQTQQSFSSVSELEPTNDLKQIESLFYNR